MEIEENVIDGKVLMRFHKQRWRTNKKEKTIVLSLIRLLKV